MRRPIAWLAAPILLSIVSVTMTAWADSSPPAAPFGADRGSEIDSGSALYRAFPAGSYWNMKLPTNAPVSPDSKRYLDVLRAFNFQHPRFAGISQTGAWGIPVYWSTSSDHIYNVTTAPDCPWPVPAAFGALRIPLGATPDASADSEMTVYDRPGGVVAGLWHAAYDQRTDSWQACAGSAYYLASNGLYGKWPKSTDPRNTGHRGLPPSVHIVRWDEIQAGLIPHVLEMVVSSTCGATFPMVWGEGCGEPLLEGTRIRIKPSVDLRARGLRGAALTVATALQAYGAVIGDCNGSHAATIKVENTVREGRGQLWTGVLDYDSLGALTWNDFEVIRIAWGE